MLDQKRMARRGFLKLATIAVGVVSGAVVGIPLIDALIGPALRKATAHWTKVTRLDAFSADQPADLTFPDEVQDAYVRETVLRSVWAVKHSATDVTVFAPICPHLGCGYNWDPETSHFECPCHGSVFDIDGKVIAGPSPRPLDTLPAKIEGGELYVEWQRFKLGVPEKVQA